MDQKDVKVRKNPLSSNGLKKRNPKDLVEKAEIPQVPSKIVKKTQNVVPSVEKKIDVKSDPEDEDFDFQKKVFYFLVLIVSGILIKGIIF